MWGQRSSGMYSSCCLLDHWRLGHELCSHIASTQMDSLFQPCGLHWGNIIPSSSLQVEEDDWSLMPVSASSPFIITSQPFECAIWFPGHPVCGHDNHHMDANSTFPKWRIISLVWDSLCLPLFLATGKVCKKDSDLQRCVQLDLEGLYGFGSLCCFPSANWMLSVCWREAMALPALSLVPPATPCSWTWTPKFRQSFPCIHPFCSQPACRQVTLIFGGTHGMSTRDTATFLSPAPSTQLRCQSSCCPGLEPRLYVACLLPHAGRHHQPLRLSFRVFLVFLFAPLSSQFRPPCASSISVSGFSSGLPFYSLSPMQDSP